MPEGLYQIWGELIAYSCRIINFKNLWMQTFGELSNLKRADWIFLDACSHAIPPRPLVGVTDCAAFKFAQKLGLTLKLWPGWWDDRWTLWGLDKRSRHKCLRSAVRSASWCRKPLQSIGLMHSKNGNIGVFVRETRKHVMLKDAFPDA